MASWSSPCVAWLRPALLNLFRDEAGQLQRDLSQNQSGHSPQVSDVLDMTAVREYLGTLQKDTVTDLSDAFAGLQTFFSSSAFISVWSCSQVVCSSTLVPYFPESCCLCLPCSV